MIFILLLLSMLKTGQTKCNLSVTIDKEIRQKFEIYCKRNWINKSKLVEDLIEKHLEKKDIENNGNSIRKK